MKKTLFIITISFLAVLFVFGSYASADFKKNAIVKEKVELVRETENLNPNEVIALSKKYHALINDTDHFAFNEQNHGICITRTNSPLEERVSLKREEDNLNPNQLSALIKEYESQSPETIVVCTIGSMRAGLSVDERIRLAHEEHK